MPDQPEIVRLARPVRGGLWIHLPVSSEPLQLVGHDVVRFARLPEGDDVETEAPAFLEVDVCDQCGWFVVDENSAGPGQDCEAWLIDGEIGEHGPTSRYLYLRQPAPDDVVVVAMSREGAGSALELLDQVPVGWSLAVDTRGVDELRAQLRVALAQPEGGSA